MNNEQAIQILKTMNARRRFDSDGAVTLPQPCPYEFGRAIDYAVERLARYEKALEDIRKHQEIIAPMISKMGTTWVIANRALSNAKKGE